MVSSLLIDALYALIAMLIAFRPDASAPPVNELTSHCRQVRVAPDHYIRSLTIYPNYDISRDPETIIYGEWHQGYTIISFRSIYPDVDNCPMVANLAPELPDTGWWDAFVAACDADEIECDDEDPGDE
jgi:hypothetical protein